MKKQKPPVPGFEEPFDKQRVREAKDLFEEEKNERDDDYEEIFLLNQSIEQEDSSCKFICIQGF